VAAPRLEEGAKAWYRFSERVGAAARSPAADPEAARRLGPFAGGYGPALFDEVARYAQAVVEATRTRHFDIIHGHDWMTFPAGIAVARATGRPFVAQVHASEYDRSGDHPDLRVRDIEQMGIAHADRVVTVSHYTASVLRARYVVDREKLRVVHNAVSQEESRRGRWQKTIPEPVVLFLGRVTFQKGPDYFLEAARKVVERRPDVKFVMSGSGDMLPRMIEHAARLGIARNVHFTGFLRGRDVERMYALADLYVMPSVSEPFGITPLEAMALDVPVIVSRQSGVSEILRHALKVDFWDVEDLANKILAVLNRPVLRQVLRDEGRAEVRRLRWEASGARLRRIYEELLS
jgi:glycosyltransferase involved in cell wall biosynthesis